MALEVSSSLQPFFLPDLMHHRTERLVHSAWTDRQINGFLQSFTALKQALETGTSIQTALVCFRLDENVNKLGEMHPNLYR